MKNCIHLSQSGLLSNQCLLVCCSCSPEKCNRRKTQTHIHTENWSFKLWENLTPRNQSFYARFSPPRAFLFIEHFILWCLIECLYSFSSSRLDFRKHKLTIRLSWKHVCVCDTVRNFKRFLSLRVLRMKRNFFIVSLGIDFDLCEIIS